MPNFWITLIDSRELDKIHLELAGFQDSLIDESSSSMYMQTMQEGV